MLGHRLQVAVVAAMASVLAVGCSAATGSGAPGAGSPSGSGALPTQASVSPDAKAKVLASIPVPGNPSGMVAAHGSVWVASRHTGTVVRIDPKTNAVTATVTVGGEPAYVVDDGTAVWVVEFTGNALARIDPATNAVTTVALPGSPGGWPVFGAGAIFQATSAGIAKVDPSSRAVVKTVPTNGQSGVAFGAGLVWTGAGAKGLTRLDPATLAVKDTIDPDVDSSGVIAFDGTWMWSGGGSTVTQLDATSGTVLASYKLPENVDSGMGAASGGRFWVQQGYPDAFAFIDGKSMKLAPFQDLPTSTTEQVYILSVAPHDVWIADWDANTVYRVDPGS